VEQETAHELANGELHDLILVVAILTVVLPAEADMLIREFKQPRVADGDAVGVPRKISQDLLWSCEWTLGVNDPFPRAQGSEVGLECFPVPKRDEIGEELQLASIESCRETFEEQTAEQAREHPNRQEEVRTASHPPSLAARHPAPWRRKTPATSRIGRGIARVSARCCRLHI